MRTVALVSCLAVVLLGVAARAEDKPFPKAAGYTGIWFTLGQKSEYGDKYSGGLATYTTSHTPIAIYAPKVNKTFFVYGGCVPGKRHLLAMASYFDHATQSFPKPTIVHDKQTVDDPHDNPSLAIDEQGYVWVFVAGRGNVRPGFKYRSTKPYDVDSFELVETREKMAYPQPWVVPGKGFFHFYVQYTKGRELYFETSADGKTWDKTQKLAGFGGHYQTTLLRGQTLYTAFNYHPGGNVDKRTNLYFLKTDDMGKTWTTAGGDKVEIPLNEKKNAALVRDYEAEGRMVYIQDVTADAGGQPVILYVESGAHLPGPQDKPRTWQIARYHDSTKAWAFTKVCESTSNYDVGALYVEWGGPWRIIGPTEPGPQKWGTGGEIALWESPDDGKTWKKIKQMTQGSPRNHSYVRRPVGARADFYGIWADGNADEFSESMLYYCNRDGDVFRLPAVMDGATGKAERVK